MSSKWSDAQRAEIKRRLREGESPTDIARDMGLRRESIRQYGKGLAASCPVIDNVQSVYSEFTPPYRQTINSEKPRIRVPAGKRTRILYFTDTHHHPGGPTDHIRWIARHARQGGFDLIRQGGDFCDYDSVSTHDPIGSVQAKHKPSLAADLEANEEALAIFNQELGPSSVPKVFDCGNHEKRIHKYEMLRGELEGSLWFRLQELYAQYGWTFNDFGVITFVDHVGFTHIPIGANGKPYASPQIMLRDMTHDLVIGHRHKGGMYPMPKIGGDVTLYDGACSLPHGTVKEYAKLNPTGWKWGVNEITIMNGKVTDFSFISMLELQRRYA